MRCSLTIMVLLTGCTAACFGEVPMEGGGSSSSGEDVAEGDPSASSSTTPSSTSSSSTTTGDETDESTSGLETSEEDGSSASTAAVEVDYALAFEGDNDGVTPPISGLPANFTIEFWLRSGPQMHGTFLTTATIEPTPTGWVFVHDEGPGLAFPNVMVFIDYDERPTWQYLANQVDLRTQVGWHHIAATKSLDGLVRLWIDGGLTSEYQFDVPFGVSERPLKIGPSLFDATIDDIRISSVVRYDDVFEPPTDVDLDADTLYLWRLDEGSGDEAVDEVEGVVFDLKDPVWVER